MARFAVISDIHGNMSALAAVLADMAGLGIHDVYCLGDLVGYGPFPNEVIGAIRALQIPTVLGNYDDAVAFGRHNCGCLFENGETRRLGELAFAWTKAHVLPEGKQFLRILPPDLRTIIAGREFLFVHGSPRRINEYVSVQTPQATLEEIAAASAAEVALLGHTHIPFVREAAGVKIINAGSAGKPKGGDPRACYAVIDLDGRGVEATFRRVPYDLSYVVSAIRRSGLPVELGEQLEQGR